MKFIIGRGNRRQVYEGAHGSIVNRSPEAEQKAYVSNVQNLLGIKG